MSDLESAWKELEAVLPEEFMLEVYRWGPRLQYGKTDITYEAMLTSDGSFGAGLELPAALRSLAADIREPKDE